jgi:hypothetical protein
MAQTPDIEVSGLLATAVIHSITPDIRVSSFEITAVYRKPTTDLHMSGLMVTAPYRRTSVDMKISNLQLTAVVRSRTASPYIAAWTFTLDGHDYYVIQLPTKQTLVLDLLTGKWYVWGSGSTDQWRARLGLNWSQANLISSTYNSDIVCGDDTTGTLYFLDPDYPLDDAADASIAQQQQPFQRITYGQIPLRGLNSTPCFGVLLSGSLGYVDNENYTTVELQTSDDQGNTFDSQGVMNMVLGQYNQRLYWTSCGSMQAPGRLFKIIDFGGVHRIDGLYMDDPDVDPNATS